jgi:hypothetical protein
MKTEARAEHRWLQQLVGEWTSVTEMAAAPGESPERMTGRETVRSVGEVWVVCEGSGEMPGGGGMESIMTIGYDSGRNRFVGSWIGSPMTHLWVYDGELDPSERTLTLESEGPDFTIEGATARYRDVIRIHGDDRRTLTSYVLAGDGEWQHMVSTEYRRVG